jgi:hypothetical protein
MILRPPPTRTVRARRGITLLEVLIACGLLVVGLSTMASLLPAAGSRLAQASLEDRAGVLTANALAELTNRRLVAADAFEAGGRSLVIGRVVERLPDRPEMRPRGVPLAIGPTPAARARCGTPRTFLLEDELLYGEPRLASTPANAFATLSDGAGPRRCRQALCWGAMISAASLPPTAGGLARLTIAVFRKEGGDEQIVPITLSRSSNHYRAAGLGGDDSLLEACSWVLAVPPGDNAAAPRWFQIMSAWRFPAPADPSPRVIFRDQAGFEAFTATAAADATATVLWFEGLVRIDERDLTLE